MSAPVSVGKMADNVNVGLQGHVLGKLILFALLVAFVPITTYFTTLKYVFDGSTAKSAISAIVSANIIMVAYVVVAFREDIAAAPPRGLEAKKKLQ